MATGVIQIDNLDGKLGTTAWTSFKEEVQELLEADSRLIHFRPMIWSFLNQACWVFEVSDRIEFHWLRDPLVELANKYGQDSIALTYGETEFVTKDAT